jgi:hypothetical protein
LEGSVVATILLNRTSQAANGTYSWAFSIEDGERCFSANGRSGWPTSGLSYSEGADASEACINRIPIPGGFAVANVRHPQQ